MSEHWVCSRCLAVKGLRGADLGGWPSIDDKEAQAQHIESVHHVPVARSGETEAETFARFRNENPAAGGPDCQCPTCSLDLDIRSADNTHFEQT